MEEKLTKSMGHILDIDYSKTEKNPKFCFTVELNKGWISSLLVPSGAGNLERYWSYLKTMILSAVSVST